MNKSVSSKQQKRRKRFRQKNEEEPTKNSTLFNVGFGCLLLSLVGMILPLLFGSRVYFGNIGYNNLGYTDTTTWFIMILVFGMVVYWIYKGAPPLYP